MGINKIWEEIDKADVCQVESIAELAATHFHETGRPLRIAVDAAYWSFKNLSSADVERIRKESHRASNADVKNILYRICKYRRLGIDLLFIFDGKNRPVKRKQKTFYGDDATKFNLLTELLTNLGIRWYTAPAEAEAECAALQLLGSVDAVFSEDSDAFMFGCSKLMRFDYIAVGKKSDINIKLYSSEKIEEKICGLNQNGFVLWCAMVGGDYNPQGLLNVGPAQAKKAIAHGYPEDWYPKLGHPQDSLGSSLRRAFEQKQLPEWRAELNNFFAEKGLVNKAPPGFPNHLVIKNCFTPEVSGKAKLESYRAGDKWNLPIDEEKLKVQLVDYFNFDAKNYIDWIIPMLFIKEVLDSPPKSTLDSQELQRRLKCKEVKRNTMVKSASNGSKVSFSLSAVTSLDMTSFGPKTGKLAKEYVHKEQVELDISDYILELVLPSIKFEKYVEVPTKEGEKKRGRPKKPAAVENVDPKNRDPKLEPAKETTKKGAVPPITTSEEDPTQSGVLTRKPGRPRKTKNLNPNMDLMMGTSKKATAPSSAIEAEQKSQSVVPKRMTSWPMSEAPAKRQKLSPTFTDTSRPNTIKSATYNFEEDFAVDDDE